VLPGHFVQSAAVLTWAASLAATAAARALPNHLFTVLSVFWVNEPAMCSAQSGASASKLVACSEHVASALDVQTKLLLYTMAVLLRLRTGT